MGDGEGSEGTVGWESKDIIEVESPVVYFTLMISTIFLRCSVTQTNNLYTGDILLRDPSNPLTNVFIPCRLYVVLQ